MSNFHNDQDARGNDLKIDVVVLICTFKIKKQTQEVVLIYSFFPSTC